MPIELTLTFNETRFLPLTTLTYRASKDSSKIQSGTIKMRDMERAVRADADLIELALRYRQKRVDRATLSVDGIEFLDADGDGLVETRDGERLAEKVPTWRLVVRELTGVSCQPSNIGGMQWLYDVTPSLTGEEAMARAFVASCGSLASVVHQMRSHSVLWACVPSGGKPNNVHRHLGGNIYCLFYSGRGHVHKVDPDQGFQTVPIEVNNKAAPFQLVTLPTHLWYQVINAGSADLLYFMISEPAFDPSELLELEKHQCAPDWRFEWV